MAKEKEPADELLEQIEAREKAVAEQTKRNAELENRLEVAMAKMEVAQDGPQELRLTSTAGKGSKNFRVYTRQDGLKFKTAVVEKCCDESEAVRTVLHHCGYRETHHIRCTVEAL